MKHQTVKLHRLSVCKCGYTLLDPSIAVGTEYVIDVDSIRGGFNLRCGGCGETIRNITVVNASQVLYPDQPMAPLPYAVFDYLKMAN